MRPEHKPLHAYRVISILCSIILFASFVLLLLVGISLPIVKAVYVIKAHAVTDGPATSIAVSGIHCYIFIACPEPAPRRN